MAMYVEIDLDIPRKMRYAYNDIADVEERAGMGIGAMFNEQRTGFHTIRLLIWGGLKWKEKGMTPHMAGDIIQEYLKNGGTFEEMMQKVREALEKSGIVKFAEANEDDEDDEDSEGNVQT